MRFKGFSQETLEAAKQFYAHNRQSGFEEGFAGREYSGRTFIGYCAFLDGCEKRIAEAIITNEL